MRNTLTILLSVLSVAAYAQPRKLVREGNRLYDQKKYKDAAMAYQEAIKKDPTYTPGLYNLGNSLYQQKQFEASRKVMETTAKTVKQKEGKSAANYNIGNTYMSEQKWEDAISAYKQALRNNPQDVDAKYNLSYAQQMLKKQNGGGGGKDNKQNKDQQNKDKQNQDKNKQDQDKNKDQQNKDQKQDDKKDQQKQDQQPQSQPSKLSEKQAEQLLNALQQEEKKLQDKMQKAKGSPVKVDKDW